MGTIKKEKPEITKEKLFYIADNYYKLNSHDMENKIKADILKSLKEEYIATEDVEKDVNLLCNPYQYRDRTEELANRKKDILYKFFWVTRMPLYEYINKFNIDDYIKNEYIKV